MDSLKLLLDDKLLLEPVGPCLDPRLLSDTERLRNNEMFDLLRILLKVSCHDERFSTCVALKNRHNDRNNIRTKLLDDTPDIA